MVSQGNPFLLDSVTIRPFFRRLRPPPVAAQSVPSASIRKWPIPRLVHLWWCKSGGSCRPQNRRHHPSQTRAIVRLAENQRPKLQHNPAILSHPIKTFGSHVSATAGKDRALYSLSTDFLQSPLRCHGHFRRKIH